MSGYFVHGGTQYPYSQNQPQSQQSNANSQQQQQSFYGNTSYPSSHSGAQTSQYSSMTSSGGGNSGNYQSNAPSGGGFNSSQQYNNSSTSSNYGGSTNANYGSGSNYSGSNYGGGSGGGSGSQNKNYGGSGNYSGGSSYSGGKSNNFSGGSYNFNKGSGSLNNSGNYNSYQNAQSTYEKALFNAANQYYSNRARGRGRGGPGRGRGSGRGNFTQPQNTGPKPIKASEIKAFLYAWCGQRKLKPEYEITTEGEPPKKVLFNCKLQVAGMDYVAKVHSTNKKDAQSKAAWEFCENLVKTGYMKQSELPPKPAEPAPKSATGESSQPIGSLPPETQEIINENGGWTVTNCRQRLNQFCQREHSTPIFKHTTLGPEHSRSFTCELTIFVDALQKEFVASETGNNKKQSTAVCALSMVRQLFKANLIERFGEPMKHVSRGGLLGGKKLVETPQVKTEGDATTTSASPAAAAPGQKRKADEPPNPEQVDENGNWTVDNSRQRLNQFCQTHNIPCDVIYEEEGGPGNRTYTASLNLKVKPTDTNMEQELTAKSSGQSKKIAAQGCALSLLSQLYKLSLVEANPSANGPNKKKQPRQRLDQQQAFPMRMPPYADYGAMPGAGGYLFHPMPMIRKTPHLDAHLNEKHKTIYPTEHELNIVQRSVRTIEQALKEVADQLVEVEAESAEKKMETDSQPTEPKKKSKLQGVMRVGALSKGLMLKGDLNVQLVLLCHEAPTAKLLAKVAQLLPKFVKASEGDTFSVVTAMHDAAISVTNTTIKTESDPALVCNITISLTSPVIRTPTEEAAKDPPGALNKDKCLQALAELRHSKWFQACANSLPSCVVVIRILRDMTRRLKEWKPLSDWALELIVEKALATSPVPLSLGGSFLRTMEVLASGILLPGGPGISDPCERSATDATENIVNVSDRENLTHSAQDVVRQVVYRQPYKILGIEPVEFVPFHRKAAAAKAEESTAMDSSA